MLVENQVQDTSVLSPSPSRAAATSPRSAVARVPVPTSKPFTPPAGLARLRAGSRSSASLNLSELSEDAFDPNWQPPSSILSVLAEDHVTEAKVESKPVTQLRRAFRRPFMSPASPRAKKFHLDLSFLDEAPPPPSGAPKIPSSTWGNRLSQSVDALTRITSSDGSSNGSDDSFEVGARRIRTRSRFFTKKITFPSKPRRGNRASVALPPPTSPLPALPTMEPLTTKRASSSTTRSMQSPASTAPSLLANNGPLPSPSVSDISSHSSIHESDLVFVNSRKPVCRDSLDTTFDWQVCQPDADGDVGSEKGDPITDNVVRASPTIEEERRRSIHIKATAREYLEPLVEIPKIPHTRRPSRISIAPRPLSEALPPVPRRNPRLSLGPLPYPPPANEIARGTIYYTPTDKMEDLMEEGEYPFFKEEDETDGSESEAVGLGVLVGEFPFLSEDPSLKGGADKWVEEPRSEKIKRRRATFSHKTAEIEIPLVPSGEELGKLEDMVAKRGRRASGW